MALVCDYMEWCELEHTMKVYMPELNQVLLSNSLRACVRYLCTLTRCHIWKLHIFLYKSLLVYSRGPTTELNWRAFWDSLVNPSLTVMILDLCCWPSWSLLQTRQVDEFALGTVCTILSIQMFICHGHGLELRMSNFYFLQVQCTSQDRGCA